LLAAALAVSARAGVVGPASVYVPPSGAWAGPLGAAFADPALSGLLPLSLTSPSLSSPEALRATAPLVQQLARGLNLTPQKFAAMPIVERKAAIELASESARDELRVKVYELVDHARALSAPGKALDREARAELYGTVARLMEVRDHYGAWLDESELAVVEDGYKIASTRAWDIRNALIGDAGAPLGAKAEAPAVARPAYKLEPSQTARQLREAMEGTKSGWGQGDFDTLYTGYGFVLRQGGKHRFYSHPVFPQLHETVSRQNDLPPGYAQSALKLIAELERLTAPPKAAAPIVTGPPATLKLADLAVLLSPPAVKIAPPKKPVVEKALPRGPPALPIVTARVAEKTNPEAPSVPAINPTLSPATPRIVEAKPEPPPAKTSPNLPSGLIERIKIVWGKLKSGPN
jgi:hypothetical protein